MPPVKIKKKEDQLEVWTLWLANVLAPHRKYGDMRVLVSGIEFSLRRLTDIIEGYITRTRAKEDYEYGTG